VHQNAPDTGINMDWTPVEKLSVRTNSPAWITGGILGERQTEGEKEWEERGAC